MNTRLPAFATFAVCIMALCAVFVQQERLSAVREERHRMVDRTGAVVTADRPTATNISAMLTQPPAELLRLRGEVARLRLRERELAVVVDENTRLRERVEERSAAASTNFTLPPGYKLRSQARLVGYGTPEQTLESFLWAIHNKDTNGVFTALTPESSEDVAREMGRASDTAEMFKELAGLAGMLVVDRRSKEDGVIELQVEVAPGLNTDRTLITFFFRRVGGEWKMDFR